MSTLAADPTILPTEPPSEVPGEVPAAPADVPGSAPPEPAPEPAPAVPVEPPPAPTPEENKVTVELASQLADAEVVVASLKNQLAESEARLAALASVPPAVVHAAPVSGEHLVTALKTLAAYSVALEDAVFRFVSDRGIQDVMLMAAVNRGRAATGRPTLDTRGNPTHAIGIRQARASFLANASPAAASEFAASF